MARLFLLALLIPFAGYCQKIENLKASTAGEKIVITYDIISQYPADKFDVDLYASSNNYSAPLQKLTGDVGKGLQVGNGRRIEWDAKAELGNYKGEILFEIRAEVIAGLSVTNEFKSAKRGKSVQLDWRGGRKNQDVKIELLKSGVSQGTVTTTSNSGSYQWFIPAKEKVGADYQLRLANGTESVTTSHFSIKHKVPTLLKVIPLVAVAAIVVASGGGSKSTSTEGTPLPLPPDLGLD
jgi:hypothetical protein